ncbi:uncharacterized protein, partial [Miscanthus floridulus]|uniref:uncharacterized protein n=1 Tax=Miscanthus floridulus TaxID=154761 RepID=UPI003458E136
MAHTSNPCCGNHGLQDNNRVGLALRYVNYFRNASMSSANLHLLEEFVGFCEAKKINLHNDPVQEGSTSRHDQANAIPDSSSFKEDIILYFCDQLHPNVIDDLCKLVNESSYGKCRFCKMPTESLVLSVLHILSDAAQISKDSKGNTVAPPILDPNVGVVKGPSVHCSQQFTRHSGAGFPVPMKCTRIPINETSGDPKNAHTHVAGKDKSFPLTQTGIEGNSVVNNFQMHSGEQPFMRSGEGFQHPVNCTRPPNYESTGVHNNGHIPVSARISPHPQNPKEAFDFLHGLKMNKQMLVLDTPLVMCKGNRMFHEAASMVDNGPIMNKKQKVQVGNSVRPVINISDERPKLEEVRYRMRTGSGQRFPITEEEVCYYNAICGLAHSQWSGCKAIEFSLLTSATYSSLGESVEPGGKVDNYFVSGMCRYFFEDVHPWQSKKHFFYPKVGGSLYTYNCSDDVRIVQKSFIGANSAYKLHLSDKLCFPVVLHKHWFVFIVDLKNKMIVFLDSYFDSNANFQIDASSKLIIAFKECWYQHAEGYTSLEDFSVSYPTVPKWNNIVDCGIFAIKFMELWDKDIDLRNV